MATKHGNDDTPSAKIAHLYLEVGCRVPLLGVDEVREEQWVPGDKELVQSCWETENTSRQKTFP